MIAAHAGHEAEVAASPRRRCAASSTSRSRCASGSRCSRASPESRPRRGLRRHRARARCPHAGAHPAPAGLPLRDRLRRLQPDHRPARRRPRHPLLARQRARDRRRPLTGRIVGDVVDRAGKAPRCASSPPRSASPRPRRSPSATAPTTSTCSTPPGSASPTTPSRSCATPPTPSVNVPYLDAIMYLLGITREEIEAADAEAGFVTPAPPVESTPRTRPHRLDSSAAAIESVVGLRATSRATDDAGRRGRRRAGRCQVQVGPGAVVGEDREGAGREAAGHLAARLVVALAVVEQLGQVGHGRVVADHDQGPDVRRRSRRIRSRAESGPAA